MTNGAILLIILLVAAVLAVVLSYLVVGRLAGGKQKKDGPSAGTGTSAPGASTH